MKEDFYFVLATFIIREFSGSWMEAVEWRALRRRREAILYSVCIHLDGCSFWVCLDVSLISLVISGTPLTSVLLKTVMQCSVCADCSATPEHWCFCYVTKSLYKILGCRIEIM